MSATELISLINRWAFVLIAAVTLLDYLRYRGQARLDVALMFASLALVILAGALQTLLGIQSVWFGALTFLGLLTQPYLLLRLVGHFQPLSRRLQWLALGGLGLSLLLLAGVILGVLSPVLAVPLVLYFVIFEGYATWAFVRVSRASTGVMRWRTLFAASGSGWLAVAILMVLVPVLVPAASGVVAALLQVFSLLAVVSYYLGFAPPKPLRRAWQLSELHHFLRQSAARPTAQRLAGTLDHLCPAVTRTLGGRATAVFLWDPSAARLVLHASDWPGWQPAPLPPDEGALAVAWGARRALQTDRPAEMGPRLAGLAAAVGARGVLAAPIGSDERARGVLLAFRVNPSLFPADDQAMLQLYAHEAAEVLESGELYQQQQTLVEQLEAANKDLEAFSYSVSHDLRAPLRAMNGFSQVLLEDYAGALDEQGQHYIRRIQGNSQKMGYLVDDLLAFSRFGRQPLKLQSIDPAEVARQAWDDLRHDHAERAVQLDLASLPPCQADASLLKQVYINLLSNALKFTRQQPLAQISVGCRAGTDGATTYFVRDNGVGFDMAYANKLFGVFQRLHRAEDFEGTGVGLAIVQRIVERHGGRVAAESTLGQGATFYFTLKGA